MLALAGVAAAVVAAADPKPGMYELYRPTIEYGSVVSPTFSPLQYNHDSSIALLHGVWVAVWNANTEPLEGKAGQYNVMSTSSDLKSWSVPVHAFSDPAHATNPVPCDLSTCVQWQPNLFMLPSGKLGCVWSGSNGRAGRVDGSAMVTYFSTLTDPSGKWTNQALTFKSAKGAGGSKPFFNGANWTLFASQNPTVLPTSGRILAPVVMTSSALAKDADPGCKLAHVPHNVSQMCFERRSSVVISDDNGSSWRQSEGTEIPNATWAQWEPTVWAPANGSEEVFMISRFNDFRLTSNGGPAADQRMQRSRSTNGGDTWTPLEPLPLDTVVSRMQVMAQRSNSSGDRASRFLMVMNDVNPLGIRGTAGRLNVALYFAPAGAPDIASFAFAPGPGLSSDHEIAMYPQMWQDEKKLAVIWSSGDTPRGIRVASMLLPRGDKKAVSIRNNTSIENARPERTENWLKFFGQQRLESATPINNVIKVDDRIVSAGAWVRLQPTLGRSGTLIDTRGLPKGGFIFGIKANRAANWTAAEGSYTYAPYAWLGPHASKGSTTNVELPHGSRLSHLCTRAVHQGHAVYVAVSVNATQGRATFFVAANGEMVEETVDFDALDSFGTKRWPAAATRSNITVGFRNVPSQQRSSIGGLIAELGSVAVLGGEQMLSATEHATLANVLGQSLGVPTVRNASGWVPNRADAALWLDSSSSVATLQHDFPLPRSTRADKPRVQVDGANGNSLLRLCQNSSASVELPPVTCNAAGPGLQATVRVRLQPAVATVADASARRFTILTVGDGESHVRLVALPASSAGAEAATQLERDADTTTYQLRLMCSASEKSTLVSSSVDVPEDVWTTLELTSTAGMVSVNGSAALHCPCSSGGPIWVFLGEGFLDRQYRYGSECVEHDLGALYTTQTLAAVPLI
jgi:hypothetical protein